MNKKFILISVLFLIAFAFQVLSATTVFWEDDFNRPDNATVGVNWTETSGAGGISIDTNKLELDTNNDGGANMLVNREFTNITPQYIEFKMRLTSVTDADGDGFQTFDGGVSSEFSIQMAGPRNHAKWQYYNGAAWIDCNLTLTANTDYNTSISISWAADKFNVSVNGSLICVDATFVNDADGFDAVQFYAGKGGSGIQTYDYVKFYNITEELPDTTPPTINLTSPADGSTLYYKDRPFTFKANAIDESGIAWCALYHNGSGDFGLIENKSGIVSGEEFSFDPVNIERKTIIWNVQCADNSTNQNQGWAPFNYTLTIANSLPEALSLLPPLDYHDKVNLTVNFTYTDPDNDNGNCSFYLNNSLLETKFDLVNGTFVSFEANLSSDGLYTWRINCTDGFDFLVKERNYTLDTINPIIRWYYPLKQNTTISNKDLSLNVSCFDENLYQLLVNVADSSDTEIYTNLSNATGTTLTATDTVPLTDEDIYTVKITCSDKHTAKIIPDYDVTKDENKLTYDTGDNIISIYLEPSALSLDDFSTEKLKDRYTFSYDFSSIISDETIRTFVFVLEAEHPLIYLKDSEYKAHFISNKNWIDFNLDDEKAEYDIKKINDNHYKISITTTKTLLDFSSIGGLNIVEESATYEYEITAPTYTNLATNGSDLTKTGESVHFNVTWFDEHPSHYVFCFGDGVDCVNETEQVYASGENITVVKTITAVHNQQVKWQFFANDTVGNWDNTPLASFTIANTVPSAPTSIIYTAPAVAYTDSLLVCNASGSYDVDNEEITYYYKFNDTTTSVLQDWSITNTFNCDISGCDKGDTIYCHAKAYDGYDFSEEGPVAGITIQNKAPEHNTPLLTSSSGTNYTNENLTCYNQSTLDADNDEVVNIYNWYKNNQPLTVLNMPFEGGSSGNYTKDYSGKGNDGSVNGATWNSTAGIIGGAYEFDGDGDYIEIPDNDNLDLLTHDLSISAWVNYKPTGDHEFIVGKRSSGWQDGYGFYISSAGDMKCVMYNNTYLVAASAPYTGSGYTFVSCVMDRDDKIYIYQNGVLAGSSSSLAGTNWETEDLNSPRNFMVGVLSDAIKINEFNGTIDEVKIYPYALAEEQIRQNYLDSKDGFSSSRTIVSNETTRYDTWNCGITPNDGEEDGTTKNSTALTIRNYPPDAVNLLSPSDGAILGALPEFNWTSSFDIDPGDTISYILEISTDSNFAYLNYTNTSTGTKDENVVLISNEIHKYYWRVIATDGIDNTSSVTRTFNYSQWNITFNVTSSKQEVDDLDGISIVNCTYLNFDQAGDTTNLYGPYAFPTGSWTCTFKEPLGLTYFDKTQSFTVNSDMIVDVIMPERGGATYQEHTWLEALYNCIILKDCDLWDLLITINQTASNIWQNVKPTDESVITTETEINRTLNSTSNITYQYEVNIPIKAGYSLGTYLPVRIGFWFMNESNESCYSQGTLPDGVTVIEPYCNPLMVETLGPMGGNVNFKVDLRPNLTAGTYNVKRIIEIDPDNVWEGYGQEVIGQITVTEDMSTQGDIGLEKTGETMPDTTSDDSSDGSSGGGGGGSTLITNIINIYNITNIIIEESEEKEGTEGVEEEEETLSQPSEEETESKEEALAGITGRATADLPKASPIIGSLIIMFIIVGGLVSYSFMTKKE